MKRHIIFLLTVLVIQSVNAVGVIIDGLRYSLIAETHEAIVSYGNTCGGNLVIPSEVSYKGQTFIVKSMLWKAFSDCHELTKVRIPKTLENVMHYYPNDPDEGDIETILISPDFMNPFTGCTALESIDVDKDNPSMKSVNGVLFSKDGTRLYAYPSGIKAISYVVPQGVMWVGIKALSNANLRQIDLPESLQTICSGAFQNCTLDVMIIRGHLDEQSLSNGFIDCLNESAKLYVPALEVKRYKNIFAGEVLPLEEYTNPVTFTAGQMATIILPSEPDASKGKYYRLAGCKEGEIVFEQELQPRAHVPYIIVPHEDFSIDPAELELAGLTGDTVSVDGVRFIGTYVSEVLPSLGGDGGGFYYDIIDQTPDCSPLPGEGPGVRLLVGALRAYLLVDWKTTGWNDPYTQGGTKDPWQKMEIVLKDERTGMDSHNDIKNEELRIKNDRGIYDLHGRRVSGSKLPRGIYIKDGRKKRVR